MNDAQCYQALPAGHAICLGSDLVCWLTKASQSESTTYTNALNG